MNQDLRPSACRRFTFAFDGEKVFVYAVKVVATFGPYSQIMRGDLRGGQIVNCIPSKWLWRKHHEAMMAGKRYLEHKGISGMVSGTGNAFARSNESVCGAGSTPAIARHVLRGTTSGCFDGQPAANATLHEAIRKSATHSNVSWECKADAPVKGAGPAKAREAIAGAGASPATI